MLMLTTDRHQQFAQRLQLCKRYQVAINIGAAPTAALHNASQNELIVYGEAGDCKCLQNIITPGQIKKRFHSCFAGACTNEIRTRAVTQQQAKSVEDN